MKWRIPLYKVFNDDEDLRAVSKVIQRGMDWAMGPEIEHFERLLAEYVSADFCLAFNSGTSALHAALLAAGITQGDEILVPSFTFIATANSTLMVNAKPKFIDIEEETFGINPNLIESHMSRRTKAIIPIHYAGLPCKINEISDISKKRKIHLIEDAAESLGGRIGKKMVGTFGELCVFSFAGNKVLTTGEGGAITTSSKRLFEKLKLIRSHGRKDEQNYFSSMNRPKYVTLGFNWRMSSITAALAISQLNKIDKLINLRRKNAKYLSSRLAKCIYIHTPHEPRGYHHAYQLYSILLPNTHLRNKLMQFLARKGIMSKVFFYPIHKTIFYKKLGYSNKNELRVTESVSDRVLSLPMYPGLKKQEMNYICDSINEFMEEE